MGAAYGMGKRGINVAPMGVMWLELVTKSMTPVVTAGIAIVIIDDASVRRSCRYVDVYCCHEEETYFALLDVFKAEQKRLKDEKGIGQKIIDLNFPFKRQKLGLPTNTSEVVLDPCTISAEGAPRKRIKSHIEVRRFKCELCKIEGHTRRICPKLQRQFTQIDRAS